MLGGMQRQLLRAPQPQWHSRLCRSATRRAPAFVRRCLRVRAACAVAASTHTAWDVWWEGTSDNEAVPSRKERSSSLLSGQQQRGRLHRLTYRLCCVASEGHNKDPPTAAVTLGPGSKVAFHTMEEDRAAATIAAAKRGKNARKQAAERKEQSKASSTIAAARKGKNARKERQEMSDGAVRIQSQYRGRQSRARCAETGADQAQRYYTPAEVAKHDRADDLRVSLFGKVLDLSELVRANRGLLVQPLIAAAGTDITHWFDDSTHDPCTYIDPETEIEVPFTPMGRFLHCVPVSCAPPSRGSSRLSCL